MTKPCLFLASIVVVLFPGPTYLADRPGERPV